jgi:hypothetical protein
VDELLQVYNVNDVICKKMTLQQQSHLVATPQLTPFKILVAATSLVLDNLQGGGVRVKCLFLWRESFRLLFTRDKCMIGRSLLEK